MDHVTLEIAHTFTTELAGLMQCSSMILQTYSLRRDGHGFSYHELLSDLAAWIGSGNTGRAVKLLAEALMNGLFGDMSKVKEEPGVPIAMSRLFIQGDYSIVVPAIITYLTSVDSECSAGQARLDFAATLSLARIIGFLGDVKTQKYALECLLHYAQEQELALNMVALAMYNFGLAQVDCGDVDAAISTLQAVLAMQADENSVEAARVYGDLAVLRGNTDDLEQALALLEHSEVDTTMERGYGMYHLALATGTQAQPNVDKSHVLEMVSKLQEVQAFQKDYYGTIEHPAVAETMRSLAEARGQLGDAETMRNILSQVLSIQQEKLHGTMHQEREIAKTKNLLDHAHGLR
jgi:hypothetical protein